MSSLLVASMTVVMFLGTLGGWQLVLRSACSAQNWKQEIVQTSKRLKTTKLPYWLLHQRSTCPSSLSKWNFQGKLATNQKGSAELLGCIFLTLIASAIGLMICLWQLRHQQVSLHLKQTLCLKTAILETNQMVSRINRMNIAITSGEVTSLALIFVGGIGLATRANWEKIKRALQLAQEVQWMKSQAILIKLKRNRCNLPPHILLSPYQWRGRLVRSFDGRALMRGKQSLWPVKTPLLLYVAQWKSGGELSPHLQWEIY